MAWSPPGHQARRRPIRSPRPAPRPTETQHRHLTPNDPLAPWAPTGGLNAWTPPADLAAPLRRAPVATPTYEAPAYELRPTSRPPSRDRHEPRPTGRPDLGPDRQPRRPSRPSEPTPDRRRAGPTPAGPAGHRAAVDPTADAGRAPTRSTTSSASTRLDPIAEVERIEERERRRSGFDGAFEPSRGSDIHGNVNEAVTGADDIMAASQATELQPGRRRADRAAEAARQGPDPPQRLRVAVSPASARVGGGAMSDQASTPDAASEPAVFGRPAGEAVRRPAARPAAPRRAPTRSPGCPPAPSCTSGCTRPIEPGRPTSTPGACWPSSTSTRCATSTTASAPTPATPCCARSPPGCQPRPARRAGRCATAAPSSRSCSRASTAPTARPDRPRHPRPGHRARTMLGSGSRSRWPATSAWPSAATRPATPADLVRDAHQALVHARDLGAGQLRRARRVPPGPLHHPDRRGPAALGPRRTTSSCCTTSRSSAPTAASLIGVEALLRWQAAGGHQHRHAVPPRLPAAAREVRADRAGGRWVIEETCRQAVAWTGAHPDVAAAVRDLQHRRPPARHARLRRHRARAPSPSPGCRPEQLCLDITEQTLRYNGAGTWSALRRLKEAGVKLGLDDFGTGAASLTRPARPQPRHRPHRPARSSTTWP